MQSAKIGEFGAERTAGTKIGADVERRLFPDYGAT